MPVSVTLSDLLNALECPVDGADAYVDRETGQVHIVTEEDRDALAGESDDRAPEWQKPLLAIARDIEDDTTGRFVSLPDRFEVDEWSMAQTFSRRVNADLERTLHAGGAFRRFKDALRRAGLTDQWHAFRDDQLQAIALDWCEEHDFKVVDDSPGSMRSGHRRSSSSPSS